MNAHPTYNTLDDALIGTTAPREIVTTLALVNLPYLDMAGAIQNGQIIVAKGLVGPVTAIFAELLRMEYRIASIIPLQHFAWSDAASIAANNTAGFNYRLISGTDQPSLHALGLAIDINPRLNPYFGRNGVEPANAVYDPTIPYTLVADDPVVRLFKAHGATWLGDRTRDEYPDYQHFQWDSAA